MPISASSGGATNPFEDPALEPIARVEKGLADVREQVALLVRRMPAPEEAALPSSLEAEAQQRARHASMVKAHVRERVDALCGASARATSRARSPSSQDDGGREAVAE